MGKVVWVKMTIVGYKENERVQIRAAGEQKAEVEKTRYREVRKE